MPKYYVRVTELLNKYFEEITGGKELTDHRHLLKVIAKYRPAYQTEIFDFIYRKGYEDGYSEGCKDGSKR